MQINDILQEASYPGNIGAMEVFKFYQTASDGEKEQLASMLDKNEITNAWELIKDVTGVQLHPMGGTGE